jgi:hypothetical protein
MGVEVNPVPDPMDLAVGTERRAGRRNFEQSAAVPIV